MLKVSPNMRINAYIMLILFQYPMGSWMICIQKYTNVPLDGYYCEGIMNIFSGLATEAICKQTCFRSPTCGMVAYNTVNGSCLLTSQPCAVARKHAQYRLMIFRQEKNVECTVWVRDQAGIIPDRVVTPDSLNYVARIAVGGDILVGSGNLPGNNWNTHIAHGGRQIYYPNQDLLTVYPNCTMAWVPYTAGDALPRKAIVTGMLANGRRLYSILSWKANIGQWVVGVYAEKDTAGYYPYSGSNAVTQFDILVSVWGKGQDGMTGYLTLVLS